MSNIISRMPHKIIAMLIVMIASSSTVLWSYPLINSLETRDKIYSRLVQSLQNIDVNDTTTPKLFEYKLQAEDTLLSISKLTKVSISALITINRSNSIEKNHTNNYIIIPATKGVFLPVRPTSDLEYMLYKRLKVKLNRQLPITVKGKYASTSNTFYFLPQIVLTKIEYKMWLNTGFRVPVLEGYVSSYFGYRQSPISGNGVFHKGIDIAAASGDEIFASQSGVVVKDGFHVLFGYYVVVDHKEDYSTLYGHMLDSTVDIGDIVYAGQQIGYMGSTGASTGSHIHFEVHRNNKAIDPMPILGLEK